jgi:hypothetical protein
MDLTLRRRPERRVPERVHALGVLLAAGALSVGFLAALSDLVARLG